MPNGHGGGGSRGIALHIVDPIARREWVVNATPWPLDPAETGPVLILQGLVRSRAGLDGYGKSHPHRPT
jgi:hypothetical protein